MTHRVRSSPPAGEDLGRGARVGRADSPKPVTHWRRRFDLAEPVTPAAEGPLSGVRIAVKDVYAVAGEQVGAGNPTVLARARVEPRHSTAVQRLVDAGAVLAGIARTDELAFSIAGVNAHEGAVVNPLHPDHLVGGSTSGPTAAVLAGEADLGLGTDTAGSIRVPASYCGLWGLRMTRGAVDVTGMWPLAPSFDAVGLVGRDSQLVASAAHVLGSAGNGRPVTGLVVPESCLRLVPPATREGFLRAAGNLARRRGVALVRTDDWAPALLERWFASFRAVQGHEAWQGNKDLLSLPGAVSEEVAERLRPGAGIDPETHAPVLAEARRRVVALLDGGRLLCLPSTSGPAPDRDITAAEEEQLRSRTLRLSFLASLAGLPALSFPGLVVGGQDLGVSLVGLPYDDVGLLQFAQ